MKIRHDNLLFFGTTLLLLTLWVIRSVATLTSNDNIRESSANAFNTVRRKKRDDNSLKYSGFLNTETSDIFIKSVEGEIVLPKLDPTKSCKTLPVVQRIRENGCYSLPFYNYYCYGQCMSIYIPVESKATKDTKIGLEGWLIRLAKETRPPIPDLHKKIDTSYLTAIGKLPDEDLSITRFDSCANCKPDRRVWVNKVVHCISKTPNRRNKRIQQITECSCENVKC